MINAYEIGARLVLDDAVGKQLGGIYDQFNIIQQAIQRTNNFLRDTGSLIRDAMGNARGLANALNAAATAAERLGKASGGIGGYGGRGGAGGYPGAPGGAGVPSLPGHPQAALGYDSGHPTSGGKQIATIPGNGRYTSGAGSNYPGQEDAPYNAGGGGGLPPLNVRGGSSGGGGFSPMHAMSSVFIAQAGYDVVTSAASALTSPSFDIQSQQMNLKNMGASGGDIKTAMNAAIAIQQKYPGITMGQALAEIANLYSVDRNMTDVSKISGGYAQAGYVISHAQGGADANDQLYSILRSSEEAGKFNLLDKRGNLDPTKAMSFINTYAKLIANSNGNLTGAGALQMTGQAGPGITQLNDTALQRMILISQSLGPSATGTGLNAMDQEFLGGKMSQATARNLHEAGLLPDYMFGPHDGKILKKYQTGIGQVRIPVGALVDQTGFLADPFKWETDHILQNYLNPDGTIKTGTPADKVKMIAALVDDYSRITGQKLAGINAFNASVVNRSMKNAAAMAPLPVLAANDAATANSQVQGTYAAWNSFLAALGSPLIPGATKGLEVITASLNAASNQARSHPAAASVFDQVAGVVAGWLGLKIGSALPGAIGRGSGAAAGFVSDTATGPVGVLYTAMQASIEASKALTSALTSSGLDGRDIAGFGGVGPGSDVGSTPQKPLYTHVTNGVPLVSSAGPTAPNGPTQPNTAITPPHPGQVSRLRGRQ